MSKAPSHEEHRNLIPSVRERIDGYRAALHEAGIPITSKFIVLGGADAETLARRVRELCCSPNRPTAFLATDSSVALVLLGAFREMNLSVPDQVSIVCFDDADWTAAVTPPLTVISQPIRDLARAATEDLIARLRGEAKATGEETMLQATLVERGSVGRAPMTRTGARRTGRTPSAPEPLDALDATAEAKLGKQLPAVRIRHASGGTLDQ